MGKGIHFFAVFCIVALSSCAGARVQTPARMAGDVQDGALRREIFSSLKRHNDSLQSLRGRAQVRYGSKIFGLKGDTVFAIQKPDSLRMDALSDFGSFASQVIFSGGNLLILWPLDNQYFQGVADRETIGRFLLIDLDPSELVAMLMSCIRLEDESDYRVIEPHGFRRDQVVLKGKRGEWTLQRLEGSQGGGFVPFQFIRRDDAGKETYRLRYEDYREKDGIFFPERVFAKFHQPKSRIEIDFKEVELNVENSKKVFQQKIPSNALFLEN